jgi:hypothetical protein
MGIANPVPTAQYELGGTAGYTWLLTTAAGNYDCGFVEIPSTLEGSIMTGFLDFNFGSIENTFAGVNYLDPAVSSPYIRLHQTILGSGNYTVNNGMDGFLVSQAAGAFTVNRLYGQISIPSTFLVKGETYEIDLMNAKSLHNNIRFSNFQGILRLLII